MSHDLTQKEPKTQIDDTDDTDDTPMEQEHDRGQEQQAQNEDMKDEQVRRYPKPKGKRDEFA